jgi:tetratricopeptide (TPR) repeat protein
MGDKKGAITDLDAAIEANEDYGKAYKLRAQIHTALGNYQEAVRDYHEASSREPENKDLKVI